VLFMREERWTCDDQQMAKIELAWHVASERCVMDELDAAMDSMAMTAQFAVRDCDGDPFDRIWRYFGAGDALKQDISLRPDLGTSAGARVRRLPMPCRGSAAGCRRCAADFEWRLMHPRLGERMQRMDDTCRSYG
jgi:hypothetical protein